MDEIAKAILSAKRKKFLRSRPVFEHHASVSEAGLYRIATGLNFKFTPGLARWLLLAGYGDIDQALSFREEFFSIINGGPLDGHVSFAQDSAGNRYVFDPAGSGIYCLPSSGRAALKMSGDFSSFMKELVRRDYHLIGWMEGISVTQ